MIPNVITRFLSTQLQCCLFFNKLSLKCCLSVVYYIERHCLTESRYIFCCLYDYVSVYKCLIYVIYFAIIIFIFITINKIILMQANLLFGCVCQKFSPRVLLSFCLHFCQFWSNVTCKSVAYKKRLFKDFFQFHSLIPNRIEVIFENF